MFQKVHNILEKCTMFFSILLAIFITQNCIVNAKSAVILGGLSVKTDANQDDKPDPDNVENVQEKFAMMFPNGIVPYYIDTNSYDSLIIDRIKTAMYQIQASSCVVFKKLDYKPWNADVGGKRSSWVHISNPTKVRECIHELGGGDDGEILIVIGYECMRNSDLLHSLLHSIGFKDEVTHPNRDQYIRIIWENIQPVYRKLFRVRLADAAFKVTTKVEYDPLSIMHFHDRAFSLNGGLTIAPKMSGIMIAPSDKLSQLDVEKLGLWFGPECAKRKLEDLLENCKNLFHKSPTALSGPSNKIGDDRSVFADDASYGDGDYEADDGENGADDGKYDHGQNNGVNEQDNYKNGESGEDQELGVSVDKGLNATGGLGDQDHGIDMTLKDKNAGTDVGVGMESDTGLDRNEIEVNGARRGQLARGRV